MYYVNKHRQSSQFKKNNSWHSPDYGMSPSYNNNMIKSPDYDCKVRSMATNVMYPYTVQYADVQYPDVQYPD